MTIQKSPYTRIRKIFKVILVLSSYFFLFFLILLLQVLPPPNAFSLPNPYYDSVNILVISTAVTSIVSLLGFISTTILEWRREKREDKSAELERQRQQIELEKMRIELDKMKATEEKPRRKEK